MGQLSVASRRIGGGKANGFNRRRVVWVVWTPTLAQQVRIPVSQRLMMDAEKGSSLSGWSSL